MPERRVPDTEPLRMWTIYASPRDYPDKFVARMFEVDASGARPTESIVISDSLDTIRECMAIQMGLTCITRSPEDEPQIVESWL